MPLPPTIITAKPRRHRKRAVLPVVSPTPPPPPPPPPTAPTLLSAVQHTPGESLLLTFDQAVAISAIDPSEFLFNWNPSDNVYRGIDTPTLLGLTSVLLPLTTDHDGAEPGTWMTAGAGNGIVAVEGGLPWTGATELAL